MNIQITIAFFHTIIYIILFALIYKNRNKINRRYSFHYNSKVKEKLQKLESEVKEIIDRLSKLEVNFLHNYKNKKVTEIQDLQSIAKEFFVKVKDLKEFDTIKNSKEFKKGFAFSNNLVNQLKDKKNSLFTKQEIETEIMRLNKNKKILEMDYNKQYKLAYNRLYKKLKK